MSIITQKFINRKISIIFVGSTIYLNARAVPLQDKVYGILRIKGSGKNQTIQGICRDFTTSLDLTDLIKQDTFFYGKEVDFEANYRRREQSQRLVYELFREFNDKTAIPKTHSAHLINTYAKIPIGRMELTVQQLELIRDVFDYAFNLLENPETLLKKQIPVREPSRYRTVVSLFNSGYPKSLLDMALSTGNYFEFASKVDGNLLGPNPQKVSKKYHKEFRGKILGR